MQWMGKRTQRQWKCDCPVATIVVKRLAVLLVVITVARPAGARLNDSETFQRSSDGLWIEINEDAIPKLQQNRPQRRASAYRSFQLNLDGLKDQLKQAPLEFTPAAATTELVISVPIPNGNYQRFRIVESPILSPALAAKRPDIKTYIGQGIDDRTAVLRADTTPSGFHAMVRSSGRTFYVDPYQDGDDTHYVSQFWQRRVPGDTDLQCIVREFGSSADAPGDRRAPAPSGDMLRTYRLAISATGEYTTWAGGTAALAQNMITTTINRVTGIFESELAIRLNIVAFNVYTNPNTDPFSNSDNFFDENQADLDANVGSANYDIGHLFSQGSNSGAVAGGSGACMNGSKAKGYTSLASPQGDFFDVDFVAHEMGHQYRGSHTWNASGVGSCSAGQYVGSAAYEPGSATTIMGYAGICGSGGSSSPDSNSNQNVQTNSLTCQPTNIQCGSSDDYYHTHSFDQIISYREGGGDCGAQTNTGNTVPTVDAGPDYTIPRQTPFTLTATGNDSDGDALTFCWEQYDLGDASPPLDAMGPLFRSRPPTSSPARTFPQMSDILSGAGTPWESLPTVDRNMTFRCTVRDNRAGGGGVDYDTMNMDVQGDPFFVVSPNGGETLLSACSTQVTWVVGGGSVAPTVDILISTDGGNAFTTVLANTPNDGEAKIIVPNTPTTMARIKVEAVGNVFFDVSDDDFTIEPGYAATLAGDVYFDNTCVGDVSAQTLYVCNTGGGCENLEVDQITDNSPQFEVTEPTSGYPVIISPDFCFPFQVLFSPNSPGDRVAMVTIPSNDPVNPVVEVSAYGTGTVPDVAAIMADNGDFGDVCLEEPKDLNLTIINNGGCNLVVSAITSDNPEFITPIKPPPNLVVGPRDSLAVPIRYAPVDFGASNATISISSNDPDTAVKTVDVSGDTPPGDIVVTGSTDFGDVCADELAEKVVDVCNVGACNLEVASAAVDCLDFTIINNPFPATVSPDFCLPLTVRFTPTTVGSKNCTLTITSNDPDEMMVERKLTGNTPVPSIDVPPEQFFPPTVINTIDACESAEPYPVSNTGQCNLYIEDIAITDNGDEYAMDGLPSFPIILEPGHIAGKGDLDLLFAPLIEARERRGEVSVTYVSDTITGATTTVTSDLCGESTRTGARLLVTYNGVAVDKVKQIHLRRVVGNANQSQVDTVSVINNAVLQTVAATGPCEPFEFHSEYGTSETKDKLLPGVYLVTIKVAIPGVPGFSMQTVGFDLEACDFNPTVIVEF